MSVALLTCDSSSYVLLYSLLYSPSFFPFNATSPYMFSEQAAFNFSVGPVSCPAHVTFNLSTPLSMDASHTLGVYFSPTTTPQLVYSAGLSSFVYEDNPPAPLLPLSSTLTPSHDLIGNFSLLTTSSVLSMAVQCPAGQHALVAADEVCTSCLAGSYISSGNTFFNCFSCPPGMFSSTAASMCSPCSAGFYQPNWGTSSCISCPAGFTSTPGNSTCAPCAKGSYATTVGTGQCTLCPQGFYADSEGASQCIACPALNGSVMTTAGTGCVTAQQCSVKVTFCADHPTLCNANETCVDSNVPNAFTCVCQQGWTGVNCSIAVPFTHSSSSSSTAPSQSSSMPLSSSSLLFSSSADSDSTSNTRGSGLLLSSSSSSPLSSSVVSMEGLLSSSLFYSSSSVLVSSSSSSTFNASCPCTNASNCVGNSTGGWSCVCPSGFTGDLCDRCEAGHYSSLCVPCTANCTRGQCSEGLTGDGSCVCEPDFVGVACDQCADGHFGVNCTACPFCDHGTCSDGLTGSGLCRCAADWNGDPSCNTTSQGILVATPNLRPPPIYLPPVLSSFVLVQLDGWPPSSSSFYSRIDTLPSYSSLWQTNDGITPITLISTANTPVADKLNRVLWQPPQQWQAGVVDNFTFSIGQGGGLGFSQTPGTVVLTVLAPPPPPTITAPDNLIRLFTGTQLLLTGISVEDDTGDVLELLVEADLGRVSVGESFLRNLTAFLPPSVNASVTPGPMSSFSLLGDVALINAVLSTMTYFASPNITGVDTLTVTVMNNNSASQLLPSSSTSFLTLGVQAPRSSPTVITSAISFAVTEYGSARIPPITVVDTAVELDVLTCSVSCSFCTLSLDVVAVPIYFLQFPSSTVTSGSSLVFATSLARLNVLLSNLTYTPVFGFNGVDPIVVNITLHSVTSVTVSAVVSHVNRPGAATAVQVVMIEDTRASFSLNSTSLDENSNSFVYVVGTLPPSSCGQVYQVDASQGWIAPAAPITAVNTTVVDPGHRLLFVLQPYVWGYPLCSFTYYAHDTSNTSVTTTTSATVSLYVSHVNHAPTTSASAVYGWQNEDLLVTLQAVDPDGDTLLYYIDALPSKGTLYQFDSQGPRGVVILEGEQLTDGFGRVIYAPQYNSSGNDSIFDSLTFSVSDGQLMSTSVSSVSIFVAQRVTPIAYAWTVVTNVDTDIMLTFVPEPSQLSAFTISQVIISAPPFPVLWSLYNLDPVSLQPIYCSLPCTVASVRGAAPSIMFSPTPGTAGSETLTYQSFNGPVYTDAVNYPNTVTVNVVAVTTTAAMVADVVWCFTATSPMPLTFTEDIMASGFNSSIMSIRINSLPSHGLLEHHDTDVVHPGGQFLRSVPTPLTTLDSSISWAPQTNESSAWPYATSFTYSLAMAPLYMYSPPATVRLYLTGGDICDILPVLDPLNVTVLEGRAVTIPLTGAGFDRWTVNITSLPLYGTLFQSNGLPINNLTQVTDPLHRLIYEATPLIHPTSLWDSFAVRGVSMNGGVGVPVEVGVEVKPANSPPVAISAWYSTTENSPLLLTLNGWDRETNASLDAVVLSLPTLGYLYVCVNGSDELNELIYTAPFLLPAQQGSGGRAQVWFAADALSYSLSTITDVYASFEYSLVDASQAQSLPATLFMAVEEVHVGPSVADITVPSGTCGEDTDRSEWRGR